MSELGARRYLRTLAVFMAVLLGFSLLADIVLVAEQRARRLRDAHAQTRHELGLVGNFVREALLTRDYQTAEAFLRRWANEREDIASLQATAPNGFVLASFEGAGGRDYPFVAVEDVSDDGRPLLTIELVRDLSAIEAELDPVKVRLVTGSIVFVTVVGVFLWLTVRRMALLPMEQAQAALSQHGAELEHRVQEHTAELRQANAELQHEAEERARTDLALNRMREYLKNIIDSMPSVLAGVNARGAITEWNQGAERATGIPAERALGRDFAELFPQFASQMESMRSAIRRREPIRHERLHTEEEGEARYSDVMVYPLLAEGEEGAVIRVEDVTSRVRMEQTMVQTEKMMSLGGLAAGMAHEINNPLSGVLQSCQNIQRRLSPELEANRRAAEEIGLPLEQVRAYLERRDILAFVSGIQDAAGRAGRIVADMLAFSRGSAAQFEPVTVEEMLDTVVRLARSDYDLKKRYDFKQVQIVREYDPTVGMVECDRTQVEQVLLNLMKNAAQAMVEHSSQPHRIRLRTRRETEWAVIEVEDNGPGISARTQRRIFEPFFTTKATGQGTGLGLSVSYFIVTEQHKGRMDVSSAPGEGSRFTVRLPLRQERRA